MSEKKLVLEQEMNMPDDWKSNSILERDGKGNIIEVIVEDDLEGDD